MLFSALTYTLLLAAPALQLCAGAVVNEPIPNAGWTAKSDSQETRRANNVALNVLDGDPSTIWHSKWSGRHPAQLPHWIKIDMKGGPYKVTGLRYMPRQRGDNGRIGEYSIKVYSEAHSGGKVVTSGTWPDDGSTKTAEFDMEEGVYAVKLNALTEAGNRGPWSSAAEIVVLGPKEGSDCGGLGEACCEPGQSGSDASGCLQESEDLTCVPEVYGPGLANTCQPCGGQADFCCTGDSGPVGGCGPGLSCEDSECEVACGAFGDTCCEPDQYGTDSSGCFQADERLTCAPDYYPSVGGTCQPCGGFGDLCCAGDSGPIGGCVAGLSCEDSECERACGAYDEACCEPGQFGTDSSGCAQDDDALVCVPEVYGPGLANTCQPCGGVAEFCCAVDGNLGTCDAGLSCEDSECEEECFPDC